MGEATQFIEGTNRMEPKSGDKPSMLSEAMVVLLSAGAGSGIGWLTWKGTGNIAVALGITGPIAFLSKNVFTNLLQKGKS